MDYDENFFDFLNKHDTKNRRKREVETTCGTLRFSSLKEAGLAVNAPYTNICQSIKRGWKCRGYYWKYSDQKLKRHPEIINKGNKSNNEDN